MYLSQTKAGELAGVSRGTIANRIRDGVLSETHEGIEISELVRVFTHITPDDIEQIKLPAKAREKRNKSQPVSGGMTETENVLQKNIEYLQQQIAANREDHLAAVERLSRQLDETKRREEEWKQQFMKKDSQLAVLLAPPKELEPVDNRSFLQRLFNQKPKDTKQQPRIEEGQTVVS